MANNENLIPSNAKGGHHLTLEEQKKGGQASVKARREKASLRQALEILLEKDITDSKGQVMSGADAMAIKLFQKALKGDTRAFEVLRDTAGQKPVEKVITADVDADVIAEVEKLVNDE